MSSDAALAKAQDVLSPLRLAVEVGTNISRRQPDVEVLAMLMQDLPTTSAAFDTLRRTNDWVCMAVGVVAVGPAGFSSVPYTSTKKNGEQEENPQGLYAVSEEGKTVFMSYEKAKNNKDRGKRVTEIELANEEGVMRPVSMTAVLEPGVCLSTFLREDTFTHTGTFFIAEDGVALPEVLPAGSFVYLQIGTRNVEQAAKGQLLKFKKIKPCFNASSAVSTGYRFLPGDHAQFRSTCEKVVETHPAIAKQVHLNSKSSVIGGLVRKAAYVSYNETQKTIVLSDFYSRETMPEGCPEVSFCADTLMREHDFADPSRLVRWINVAIACQAVGVVVLCKTLFGEDGNTIAYHGAALHIDVNAVLQLPTVQAVHSLPPAGLHSGALHMSIVSEDLVVWSDPAVLVQSGQDEKRVVFSLSLKKRRTAKPWNQAASRLLISDGCDGDFYALSIHTVAASAYDEWSEIAASVEENVRTRTTSSTNFSVATVLAVQVRPENRVQGCAKRKRPTLEVGDERDCDMMEEA